MLVEACGPPHCTGVFGRTVSGVSMPIRRTSHSSPFFRSTLRVSPSTAATTRAETRFAFGAVWPPPPPPPPDPAELEQGQGNDSQATPSWSASRLSKSFDALPP